MPALRNPRPADSFSKARAAMNSPLRQLRFAERHGTLDCDIDEMDRSDLLKYCRVKDIAFDSNWSTQRLRREVLESI